MSFVFDLLGDDFAEDELFREILGADDDAVRARWTAGGKQRHECETENGTSQRHSASQIHRSFVAWKATPDDNSLQLFNSLVGAEALLQPSQACVGEDGQCGGGNCAGQNHLIIDHRQTAKNIFAKAPCADGGGDGGDAD
jgi:hypothetical protein